MIRLLLAASTLLVPPANRPVPGIVLLPGAGAADHDGTVGPNRPLADIAAGLADRGIASIRLDPGASGGDGALRAFRELAAATGVDAKRIYVVGHAEGATIAPRVAERAGSARGLVLLALPARPVDVRMVEQLASGAKLTGRDPSEIADQSTLLAERFETARDPASTIEILGRPAAYWRDLLGLDARSAIRGTTLPVLLLQGEKDFEVLMDRDFEALRSSVGSDGGRVAYRSFPGLNHHFIEVTGVSSGAEYARPGHVDPSVIAAIADWIVAH